MNLQELFNIVWERAKDHRKAMEVNPDGSPGFCMYRLNQDPNGLACFIGAALPNEKYVPGMDALFGSLGWSLQAVLQVIGYDGDIFLAADLQRIHDGISSDRWDTHLRDFAFDHNLTIPEQEAAA